MELKEKEKFAKSLQNKSYDDLKKIEEKIIAEADKTDEEISKKVFDLPEENYVGVAEDIQYFLNKQECGWQYTLGMITLYEFWNPEVFPKVINYPTLDAALRNIGAMSFKGYNEWKRVVNINKYFEPLREAYVEATNAVYSVAEKHNMVLDALKIYETPEGSDPQA